MHLGRKPFLALAIALTLIVVTGCAQAWPSPENRKDFAKKVMSTAAAGDIEGLLKLSAPHRVDTRPDADALVNFAQGWSPDSGTLKFTEEFPEISKVTAEKSPTESKQFTISWLTDGHWALLLGQSDPTQFESPRATP